MPEITARVPRGKPLYHFTALEDFYDEELKSQYVAGLGYTVREGYDLLDRKVRNDWLPAGKVRLGRN